MNDTEDSIESLKIQIDQLRKKQSEIEHHPARTQYERTIQFYKFAGYLRSIRDLERQIVDIKRIARFQNS